MSLENNNFGFSKKELNNIYLNPELGKVLQGGLTKKEAEFIRDLFEAKKNKIHEVSWKQLRALRSEIHSKGRHKWITDNDRAALKAYIEDKGGNSGETKVAKKVENKSVVSKKLVESKVVNSEKLSTKSDKITEDFNKLISLNDSGLSGFLNKIFTSEKDLKMGNLARIYHKIKKGGEGLKIFQRYMKRKGYYHRRIDGKWGRGSLSAFMKFLNNRGESYNSLREWTVVKMKKRHTLNKLVGIGRSNYLDLIFGEEGIYHNFREKEIKQHSIEINSDINAIREFKNYDGGRTFRNIERLSNRFGFKRKVIKFFLECWKRGIKLKIIEGKRTRKQQAYKVRMGRSKTMNSAHVKGLAIDIHYKGRGFSNLKIRQIAAKYGLWNGAEMWDGWDSGHFQAYYQGSSRKKARRIAKMKRRGTYPRNA